MIENNILSEAGGTRRRGREQSRWLTVAVMLITVAGITAVLLLTTGFRSIGNEGAFNGLHEAITLRHPYINGIVIEQGERVLHEEYFNKHTAEQLQLSASVTKTFTGVLTGIADDHQFLRPEASIDSIFPGSRITHTTLHHLLSMTSGIPYDVTRDMGRWIRWDNMLSAILAAADNPPTGNYRYNDPGTHLLMYAIAQRSGQSAREFAEQHLMQPLGIWQYRWEEDRDGQIYGTHGLWLTTRDMAKIGRLLLNEGRWDGKQVVSSEWIRRMRTIHVKGYGMPYQGDYGYLLWHDPIAGRESWYAAGYGGQFVIIVPDQDLVVAIHSNIATHRDAAVRALVPRHILPVVDELYDLRKTGALHDPQDQQSGEL